MLSIQPPTSKVGRAIWGNCWRVTIAALLWPWRRTTPGHSVWSNIKACLPTRRPVFTSHELSEILIARSPPRMARSQILPKIALPLSVPKPAPAVQPATQTLQARCGTRLALGPVRELKFVTASNCYLQCSAEIVARLLEARVCLPIATKTPASDPSPSLRTRDAGYKNNNQKLRGNTQHNLPTLFRLRDF